MNCKYACEMDIAVLDSQAKALIEGFVIMLLECYVFGYVVFFRINE